MAHFVYPSGTPLGVVPFGYVVPSTEWQSTIRQVFRAINGDEGGTWAPSSLIVVGGSGFSLTGTGHQLAAGARLTVQSTAEIRVSNGGLVRLDGTGGDILMKVAAGVATIEAETGTLTQFNAGAAVDVFGSVTWKTAGSATWNTGTTGNFASGSTLNLNSGSVTNANGSFRNYGTVTIKSTGDVTFESGSQMTAVSGVTWSMGGALAITGELTLIGSNNWVYLSPDRTLTRRAFALLPLTYLVDGPTGLRAPRIFWFPSLSTNGPAAYTERATSSGDESILQLLDLPIGTTINSIVLTTQGDSGSGASTTFPTYRLVSWEDTSATGLTNHSSVVNDAHVAGDWLTAALETTITPSSTVTITAGRNYGIKVVHPYDTVSVLGTSVVISSVATSLNSDVMRQ